MLQWPYLFPRPPPPPPTTMFCTYTHDVVLQKPEGGLYFKKEEEEEEMCHELPLKQLDKSISYFSRHSTFCKILFKIVYMYCIHCKNTVDLDDGWFSYLSIWIEIYYSWPLYSLGKQAASDCFTPPKPSMHRMGRALGSSPRDLVMRTTWQGALPKGTTANGKRIQTGDLVHGWHSRSLSIQPWVYLSNNIITI